MSLSSLQLDAFVAVARTLHFSRAAKQIHLTQSALSQRIANLESDLGLALFTRGTQGVQLTEAGRRLLRYCQSRDLMEAEVLTELVEPAAGGAGAPLGGVIRIAGYSSVMRSVIIPALAPLLRENPRVHAEFVTRETRELPGLLARAEAEFIVIDSEVKRSGVIARKLGEEHYVLVESARHRSRDGSYLDHEPDDPATQEFLKATGERSAASLSRSFMGDIYGILDGVAHGLGRAVASKHLIPEFPGVRQVRASRTQSVPVLLHYWEQPYYPRLHQAVLAELSKRCKELLG